MKLCKPGVSEQYIAGVLDGIAASYGNMVSFATILSQNGQTLHNHDHSQILQAGRLMLTDAGAESTTNYCSDHTRTIPVGGKFTSRQRDVYSIVLACHDRALELARPGYHLQIGPSGSVPCTGTRAERPGTNERQRRGCRSSRSTCPVHAPRTGTHDGYRCTRHGRPGTMLRWL